ncbi:MAG: class I SAM-dependent methyltransferase [Candidatus Aenigmarchaeota archaeon]|nr:class I SAM-dependent methyltransferase [Candidatus Aenigmarchaeota archaeon]
MSKTIYDGNTTQYNIRTVLFDVGLDPSHFDGRVLDIGCGKEARVVVYLNENGIEADGVDPELTIEKPFLIKRDASKGIPKPDNHYDFAYSSMSLFKDGGASNRYFIIKLTDEKRFDVIYTGRKNCMLRTVNEVVRVLKPGHDFAVWPYPAFFAEDVRPKLERKGIVLRKDEVTEDPDLSGKILEICSNKKSMYKALGYFGLTGFDDDIMHELTTDEFMHRMVLTKPG